MVSMIHRVLTGMFIPFIDFPVGNIRIDEATANRWRAARGAFDPVLSVRKAFDL